MSYKLTVAIKDETNNHVMYFSKVNKTKYLQVIISFENYANTFFETKQMSEDEVANFVYFVLLNDKVKIFKNDFSNDIKNKYESLCKEIRDACIEIYMEGNGEERIELEEAEEMVSKMTIEELYEANGTQIEKKINKEVEIC